MPRKESISARRVSPLSAGLIIALALQGPTIVSAAPVIGDKLEGDIGVAAYRTNSVVRGASGNDVLPYGYFDYGRLFARIDTFGVKTVPLGNGFLEIVGRASFDGFKENKTGFNGIKNRSNSIPIGIGSLQETPVGNFYIYGFHDFTSGGALAEATYAAEIKLGSATLYPMLGVEYRSASYSRYLYGVSADEAAMSGAATYSPGASLSPNFGFMLEIPVAKNWFVTTICEKSG